MVAMTATLGTTRSSRLLDICPFRSGVRSGCPVALLRIGLQEGAAEVGQVVQGAVAVPVVEDQTRLPQHGMSGPSGAGLPLTGSAPAVPPCRATIRRRQAW